MVNQDEVTNYWEEEVCGTRYSKKNNLSEFYEDIAKKRYHNEPHIYNFAFGKDNEDLKNKKILEIGVGAGTDFVQFLKRKGNCYGIDATEAAIKETLKNVKNTFDKKEYNLKYLKKGNAENLPFENNYFDLVYSFGVLHHATNTMNCISEAVRVLKPGGVLKLMVYSNQSATGFMLWCLYGLGKGKPFMTQEEAIFKFLESPGTKCYSKKEFKKILSGFGLWKIKIDKYASAGDLLLMPPSKKYSGNILYKITKSIFPRIIIKNFQNKLGISMTASAIKS